MAGDGRAGAGRVAVRLRGAAPNPQGIGARISVESAGVPRQEKEVISGGQYLSGSEPLYSFAASPDEPLTIEVRWRDGHRTRIEQARSNRIYEIDEPTGEAPPAPVAEAGGSAAGGSGTSSGIRHTTIWPFSLPAARLQRAYPPHRAVRPFDLLVPGVPALRGLPSNARHAYSPVM